jgi:hypothetical protein
MTDLMSKRWLIQFMLMMALTATAARADSLSGADGKPFRRAQAPDPALAEHCQKLSETRNRGEKLAAINQDCFAALKGGTRPAAAKLGADGLVYAQVLPRMLFVRQSVAEGEGAAAVYHVEKRVVSGDLVTLDHPRAVSIDSAHAEVLVLVSEPAQVQSYPLDLHGDAPPLRRLKASALEGATDLAVDAAHDEILVANPAARKVLVYPRLGNDGSSNPKFRQTLVREIAGKSTGLRAPTGIAFDPVRDEIFVADSAGDAVLVFRRLDQGNVRPLRRIAGSSTGLHEPVAVGITAAGELEVLNRDGTLLRFGRAAQGDVAPSGR